MTYKIFRTVLLLIVAAAVIFPLIVIASSAFKNEQEIFRYPFSIIPEKPILENFKALRDRFPLYIFNSFKLTLIIVIIQAVTATMGAYAFTKLHWKGRDAVFLTYIASIMIPIHAIIIPQFIVVRNLGLYDSHLAIVLVSSFTAFGTFMVKQYFMTIPDSLVEAGRIDGAKEFWIYVHIMLPLSKPVLATIVLFSFRFFWNDFFTPLIYVISERLKTLPLGLADFVSEYTVLYGPQMAASLIALLPVMIVFLLAQKQFISGVVMTGLKG